MQAEPLTPSEKVDTRIGVLNGLRGLACIGVLYYHSHFGINPVTTAFKLQPFSHSFYLFPLTWLTNAAHSVNLFFVLSGFVLYLPFAIKSRELRHDSFMSDCWSFYTRRFKRLLPLYFFSLLVFALLWENSLDLLSGAAIKEFFLAATMTFTLFPDHFLPVYNGAYWSISVEFWFSMLFPVFVVIFQRAKARLPHNGHVLFSVLFILLTYPVRVAILTYTNQDNNFPMVGTYFDEFVAGMLACEMYVRNHQTGNRKPLRWIGMGLVMITTAFTLADNIRIALADKASGNHNENAFLSLCMQPFLRGFLNTILTFGMVYLIVGVVSLKRAILTIREPSSTIQSVLTKTAYWLLTNSPIQVVGIMCFSVYIWHIHIFQRFMNVPTPQENEFLRFLVYIPTVMMFSAMSCSLIEFPKLSNKQIFIDNISA